MDDKCYAYSFSLRDVLLPSSNVFDKLCYSYDKTNMFLSNTLRLILYMLLIKLVIDGLDTDKFLGKSLLILFGFIVIITLIMIIIILFKQQKYPKIEIKLIKNENEELDEKQLL